MRDARFLRGRSSARQQGRPRTRSLRQAVCLLVLGPLTFTADPTAALSSAPGGGWRSPEVVTRGAFAWDVAMVRGGRAVAAWYTGRAIVVARRVPGAGWLPEERLAARPDLGFEEVPSVAMNERGTVVVVYQDEHRIQAIRRPAGGTWQQPRTLVTTRGLIATPVVALGPGGGSDCIVVGKDINNNLDLTLVAIRSSIRRRLGTRRPTGSVWATSPAVVTGPRGWVTAAWTCQQASVCVAEHGSKGWPPDGACLNSSGIPELRWTGPVGSTWPRMTRSCRIGPRIGGDANQLSRTASGTSPRSPRPAAGAPRSRHRPGTTGNREVVAAVRRRSGAWSTPHLISDRAHRRRCRGGRQRHGVRGRQRGLRHQRRNGYAVRARQGMAANCRGSAAAPKGAWSAARRKRHSILHQPESPPESVVPPRQRVR